MSDNELGDDYMYEPAICKSPSCKFPPIIKPSYKELESQLATYKAEVERLKESLREIVKATDPKTAHCVHTSALGYAEQALRECGIEIS